MYRPEKNQDGIALMVVLWVLVLLTALATEFASSMKTEVGATRNYKEDVESYYLAEAGINMAMAEIVKTARFHSYIDEFGFIVGNAQLPENKTGEKQEEFDVTQRNYIPLGNGTVSYSIRDENGKININTASREILIEILAASGVGKGEVQDTIADSILDWIDKDELNRINGAETKYYQTLDPPYRSKNGPFDSLDELIRVRWVTEEILYGSPPPDDNFGDRPRYLGLDKFLTVYNVLNINPNTASPAVLSVSYKAPQVEEILAARSIKGYYNDSVSTHFKVISTGRINNSNTVHTIVAVIQKLGAGNNATLLTRYWKDNAIPRQ